MLTVDSCRRLGNTALSVIFSGYTNALGDRKLLYSLLRGYSLSRKFASGKNKKGINMNNRKNIRLLAISAILILFALPIGSGLYPRVYAVTTNLLGVACGYGASTGVFPTPITTKDGSGIASTSCDWAGDIDGDGAFDPLVADNPSLLAAGSGGGFTADIVVNNLNTMLNGFDITIHYDTNTLNAQAIDQSGLVFGGNVGCPAANPTCTLTTVTEINQGIGEVRLAQVLLASSVGPSGICNTTANPNCQSANQVLFRIRFDVVGAGSGAISFTAHILTNPNAVAHTAQDGALSTDALYSLINSQSTVAPFIVFWSFLPNPPVPGSPITFSATGGCAYCTGLSFSWDFSSVDSPSYVAKVVATGSTVTVTAPPTAIGRVTLTVSDGVHKAFATRGLPLTAAATPPASTGTGTPSAPFTATWVGGTPPYTGSWLFCPGSASVTSVCSSPTVPVNTNGQSSTVPAVTFNFAGSYNTAFTVSDPVVVHNLYTVTGTPAAYTVAVACNCTKTIEGGAAVTFNATVTYASTYPSQFRSSSFSYAFSFGDGASQTVSGGLTASATHRYTDPGNFTTTVIATETGNNAPAQIQESGQSGVTSVFDYALSVVCNTNCKPDGSIAVAGVSSSTATVTATITAGTPLPIFLSACHTACINGLAFFKGIVVTFTGDGGNPPFTAKMQINVTSSAKPGVYDITIGGSSITSLVPERDTDIIIRVGSLAANFGPTTTIVGKTGFVSTIVGGLKPYSCSWNFGDGSALDTSSCNPSHTYIAAGNFTVTLTVTDSDTPIPSTFTVSHFVVVQPGPEFSGRGVISKSSISVGSTQTFRINADNPSAFNMTVTVKIDIFKGPGVPVASLTTSITIPAGSSTGVVGQIRLSFTPTTAGTYTFTATLTYSGTVPVPPTNGATTPAVSGSAIVSGTGGLRSGSFVAG